MEGQPVQSLILVFDCAKMLLLFPLILIFFFLVVAYWYGTIPKNLPPGPLGWPLLGSSLDTWKPTGLHTKLQEWTKIYGPIYKMYLADKLIVILGNWESIHEALIKKGDLFADRPTTHLISAPSLKPGAGLVNSNGELWKTQRRFALSTLRDFGFGRPIIEPFIKDETDSLIEAIHRENGKAFDPAALLNNAVSNVICALVYGHRFEYDDDRFHGLLRVMRSRLTESGVSSLTPFVLSKKLAFFFSKLPKVKKIQKEADFLADFTKIEILKTMKGFDPKQDDATNYIQAFYKAKQEKDDNWTFTDEQLLASVTELFTAGTDTTATTLRWGIFYLAFDPELQEKLCEEIRANIGDDFHFADRTKLPLVEATIMEVQRMANLVPLGVRRTNPQPTTLGGFDIPPDTVVIPLLTAALMDPKVYPNPHKFDPTRFLSATKKGGGEKDSVIAQLIPFQAGKRVCLGESLARMELFIFFTALVSNFKFVYSSAEPKPPLDGELVSLIRAPPRYKICAVKRDK